MAHLFNLFGYELSFGRRNFGAFEGSARMLDASTQFNNYKLDKEKLGIALSNPALLKVLALQCDLFSLGKICVYRNGKKLETHPFLDMIKNPNPFQSQQQFLWDFMFWLMLGNDYTYCDSSILSTDNRLYHLTPHKIDFPNSLQKSADKLVFSKKSQTEVDKTVLTYQYDDGTNLKFPLDKLIVSNDLSNGVGNFYKGASRIDALFKPLSNSEAALDSQNINIRYSGKFLVSGDSNADKRPLGKEEKEDIETKIDDNQAVRAVKTSVDIRRFVDDYKSLALGEAYLDAYFTIGSMYNIPKDVLEAYNSGTYENQEKARGSHVSYCLQPKGNQYLNGFEKKFGLSEKGENIVIDWNHLPFMQVFEQQRMEAKKKTAETLNILVNMSIPLEEINEFLDTNFSKANASKIKSGTTGSNKESESRKSSESNNS